MCGITLAILPILSQAEDKQPQLYFGEQTAPNKIYSTERTKTVYLTEDNPDVYYTDGMFIVNERRRGDWGHIDVHWHFVDTSGVFLARNVVFAGPYDSFIPSFENGLAIVKSSKQHTSDCIINKKNEEVTSLKKFLRVSDRIQDGILMGSQEVHIKHVKYYRYSYVGVDGKTKWPHLAQTINSQDAWNVDLTVHPLCDNRRLHKDFKTNLFGYIDGEGNLVIKTQFRQACDFSEGLAAVQVDTEDGPKWGFIDTNGKFAIPPKFRNQPTDFHCQVSVVKKNTGWLTLLDPSGETLNADLEQVDEFLDGCSLMSFARSEVDKDYYILDRRRKEPWIYLWYDHNYNCSNFYGFLLDIRAIKDVNPPLRYTTRAIYTADYKPILFHPYCGGFHYLGNGFFWFSPSHVDFGPAGIIRATGERFMVFRISEF